VPATAPAASVNTSAFISQKSLPDSIMKAWAVVAHGAPLEYVDLPDLEATGTQVIVEVTRCGVCHSDLHLWHGGYDLGGGNYLSVKDRGLTLPAAPGHEIVGRVVSKGPDAKGVELEQTRLVYPWIGCGRCEACVAEQDNMCTAQRSLGVSVNGGFGTQVRVPHPRYLLDFSGIDASLAATYACSGLTAYAAAKKIMPLSPSQPVVLIGAGGLGLAAISVLKALGHTEIVSIDVSAEKRAAALTAGATRALDGAGPNAAARILTELHGPVPAVIDFVGADATAATGLAILAKGGKLVLVGVGGGQITLSVAGTIFRSQSVLGSLTGSIQDLRDVIKLAQSGRLAPTPIQNVPAALVNDVMTRLDGGAVMGRVVLVSH
jgi:alcohol dehydrogenase, propanol-preferring